MLDLKAPQWRLARQDYMCIVALWLLAIVALLCITTVFHPEIVTMSVGGRWFQSDGWRAYDDMVAFSANHYRNSVRPLFSLISIPATAAIMVVAGVKPIEAIWVFNGLCLAAWVSGIYVACRFIGLRTIESVLTGLMALASAAALFWFIVPETYGLSSLCLVLGIVLAAVHVRKSVGNGWWIAVGGLLAGTVITNWMVIVVLSAVLKPRRDALIISAASLLLMFGAWGVQKLVFPAPASFPLKVVARERAFALHPDQGGVACKLAAELVSPMLVPVAHFIGEPERTGRHVSVQCADIVKGGFSYLFAVCAWLTLLAYGAWALCRSAPSRKFGLAVLAMLGFQVLLHQIYGEETFLYALHFSPLLVVLAAGVFMAEKKRLAVGVLAALIVFAAFNNVQQLVVALSGPHTGDTDPRLVDRQLP